MKTKASEKQLVKYTADEGFKGHKSSSLGVFSRWWWCNRTDLFNNPQNIVEPEIFLQNNVVCCGNHF